MSVSATVIWITITTLSVVNGKTVDRAEVSYPTKYEYSECRSHIKSDSKRYSAERKDKRDNYAYSYKKIKCSKRKVGDFSNILKFK